ncbi:hypothetical protein Vadar_024441 [Vaccinium darrowii]|uniref:Uncharacterized protein n=1 Tax=Vaccinium darrowii TaxID=229202 RepID=A0ACB7X3A8_9ERIC|nr:hypothetical protein Vadar_024441 [Vaccinium darrowii]
MGELVALETNMEDEQRKNSQEYFIDFAAATTATLRVLSPCFSIGISFDHRPQAVSHHNKVIKGDMEGKTELLTVLNLFGAELPIDTRNMSLNSNEIAYLMKSEPEVLEETLEGKIYSKSLHDFSSSHDCSALSNCSNEVITHEAVPEEAGSYSDSSNGRRLLIDVPDAFTSRVDGNEPICEGEDREPMYEGKVVLAEQVDKRAGDAVDASKHEISPTQGDLIRNFLRNNASQLTVYCLFSLQDGLKEARILATEEGYLNQPDLVWEKLNKVNGDKLFMTGDFKEFKVESHAKTVQQPTFTGSSSTEIESILDDLLQEIIHRKLDVRDILTTFLVSRRFGRLVAKIHRVQVSLDCFQQEAEPFMADPQICVADVQEQTIPHQINILVRPYIQSSMDKHLYLPPLPYYLSVLRFVSTLAEI